MTLNGPWRFTQNIPGGPADVYDVDFSSGGSLTAPKTSQSLYGTWTQSGNAVNLALAYFSTDPSTGIPPNSITLFQGTMDGPDMQGSWIGGSEEAPQEVSQGSWSAQLIFPLGGPPRA